MPEEPKPQAESNAPKLEGAVARWNARANGVFLELVELLGLVQDDFEGLATALSDRAPLAPTFTLQPAASDDPAQLAHIERLEDGLANLHVEVQTLHAQIRRVVGALEAQSDGVKELAQQGALVAEQTTRAAREGLGVVAKTVREAQLAVQADTLRVELTRVKEELSAARVKLDAATNAPREAHTEIARLRARVLELMAREPGPGGGGRGDLSLQYERILSQAEDTEGRRRRMGEILVAAGVISGEQLEAALNEQQSAWNRHLGSVLVDLGFVSEDTVAQALAAQIKVPYVRLIHEPPKPEALALLSRALSHHHTCVPLRFERDVLVVAMANPRDLVAMDDIELATRRTIKPVVASASEIKAALKQHYR